MTTSTPFHLVSALAWAPIPYSGIPNGWKIVPCRVVVENINERNEGAAKQNYLSLMANIGVIPYEEKGDIGNKKPDDLAKCKVVRRGNLVINSMNYSIGSYGMSRYEGVCSPVYLVLKVREDVALPRFALRVFENKAFQTYVASLGDGILEHRAAIGWDDIKGIKILLPPESDQESLLKFIDRETDKIDRLVELRRRQMELLREQRGAIIQRTVTCGLNPNASLKDSGVLWVDQIPEHWQCAPLRRFWEVTDCKHLTVPFTEEGIPLASVSEVQSFELDLSQAKRTSEESYRLLIEGGRQPRRGDIIYCRNTSVGAAAYVPDDEPLAMGQDVCLIRSAKQNARYLIYLLRSGFMADQLNTILVGATFKRINVADIKALAILCPPRKEQDAIVDFLDAEGAKTHQLLSAYSRQLQLLIEYRTALIHESVTGQRPVVDPTSCGEPA